MAIFDTFPYTNFHELNLDWIIKMLRDYADTLEYVQTFDVTGEVSDKLEQMLADGELTNLLGDFPARLSAAESDIVALEAKTEFRRERATGTVSVPYNESAILASHTITATEAGDYILVGYGRCPNDSHDADYSIAISVYRSGDEYYTRTVHGNMYRHGGIINILVAEGLQQGDNVTVRGANYWSESAVSINGRLDLIKQY